MIVTSPGVEPDRGHRILIEVRPIRNLRLDLLDAALRQQRHRDLCQQLVSQAGPRIPSDEARSGVRGPAVWWTVAVATPTRWLEVDQVINKLAQRADPRCLATGG